MVRVKVKVIIPGGMDKDAEKSGYEVSRFKYRRERRLPQDSAPETQTLVAPGPVSQVTGQGLKVTNPLHCTVEMNGLSRSIATVKHGYPTYPHEPTASHHP